MKRIIPVWLSCIRNRQTFQLHPLGMGGTLYLHWKGRTMRLSHRIYHISALALLLGLGLCGCADQQEAVEAPNLPAAEAVELATITPDAGAFPPAEPDQIVFDLRYRGLSGKKDPLFQNSYYGYGGRSEDTPFVEDLRGHGIKTLQLVHNYEFVGAETSALEIHRGRPVAYYLDLNADGKVTADERITPTPGTNDNETLFLTPDFTFTNRYHSPVTFRALLTVQKYRGQTNFNCMWTPCCVLEAQGTLAGQPAHLIIYSAGLSGSFDRFGSASLALDIGTEAQEKRHLRNSLSSLLLLEDRFYRLELLQAHEKSPALRLVLTPDDAPTGLVKLLFDSVDPLETELRWLRIHGARPEDNIFLAANTERLPIGSYQVPRGSFFYGTADEPKAWTVDFDQGPVFEVKANEETTVRLGQPQLDIQAVEYNKRYESDPSIQTTYQRGDRIYLTRQVTGLAGEDYGRFETQDDPKASGYNYRQVQARITIKDPPGKQILSQDLEYG